MVLNYQNKMPRRLKYQENVKILLFHDIIFVESMAFDDKKEYKEFYIPKNKPSIIEIHKMNDKVYLYFKKFIIIANKSK